MRITHTRAMIKAALTGALDNVKYETDPIFNVAVPISCPDVPSSVLQPKSTWSDAAAYDAQARKLAEMFVENFKTFEDAVSADVRAAGPKLGQ
jgi:phosphoenolpyruvate carboxykinase (ATP)